MPEEIKDAISETATGPKSVSTPDGTVTAQSVDEQIAADRYLEGETAKSTPKRGVMFTRFVPPGGAV